jgi:hypothetical protein
LNHNKAPQITAPTAGASITLTEANADQVVPAFTWTAADFGFASETTYRLQLDLAGNNFQDAVSLASLNGFNLDDLTEGEFNNILLAKGLEGGIPVDVELRVVASVSDDVAALTSDVVSMTVVPYTSVVVLPQLQVPGSYQGWDPANNTTIIFSPGSNGLYEGYLHISPDNSFYKFTQGLSWDVNWGDTGADGTLDPGGTDIAAGAAGVYRLNVDLNGLTHTQRFTSWGLIGNATPTGWDSDTDMAYDTGKGQLSITIDLVPGFIKFRANDNWDVNFGDDGPNGALEYGGADIAIDEAGNYTIDLIILGVSKYTYEITKN